MHSPEQPCYHAAFIGTKGKGLPILVGGLIFQLFLEILIAGDGNSAFAGDAGVKHIDYVPAASDLVVRQNWNLAFADGDMPSACSTFTGSLFASFRVAIGWLGPSWRDRRYNV